MFDYSEHRKCHHPKVNGEECATPVGYIWLVNGVERQWCKTHINLYLEKGVELKAIRPVEATRL